jgi:hypothetical protein
MEEYLAIETYNFPNLGYILVDTPEIVMKEIHQTIDDIMTRRKTPVEFNNRLAGAIAHEYKMEFSTDATRMIEFLGNEWHRKFSISRSDNIPNTLVEAWINMQTKHEFNPLHDHEGILSWVIWVNIPYDLAEEDKVFPKIKTKDVSRFGFVYQDTLGAIKSQSLNIDKSWEGRMAIFPAKMKHHVAPFYTSDGIRISVAGNLG